MIVRKVSPCALMSIGDRRPDLRVTETNDAEAFNACAVRITVDSIFPKSFEASPDPLRSVRHRLGPQ